jgi:cobaltochelatase CobN
MSAAGWNRLRATPKAERKLALLLPVAPERDAEALALLHALQTDGYHLATIPANAVRLTAALDTPSDAEDEESIPRSDYGVFFAALPRDLQDAITQRWNAPERDPRFRESRLDCGCFVISARRYGNIILARETPPDLASSHGDLALYAWLSDGVRVHAILGLGTRPILAEVSAAIAPPLLDLSDPALSEILTQHRAG